MNWLLLMAMLASPRILEAGLIYKVNPQPEYSFICNFNHDGDDGSPVYFDLKGATPQRVLHVSGASENSFPNGVAQGSSFPPAVVGDGTVNGRYSENWFTLENKDGKFSYHPTTSLHECKAGNKDCVSMRVDLNGSVVAEGRCAIGVKQQ